MILYIVLLELGFIILIFKILQDMQKSLNELKRPDEPKPEASYIKFFKLVNGQKIPLEGKMFLKVSDNLPLSIEIKDKFGNAAKVDGKPGWAVTDESLGTVEVSEDGMSALFKPVGTAGVLKLQVKADADLGEGVKEILGELDLELISGEAVTIAIAAGSPVPQA